MHASPEKTVPKSLSKPRNILIALVLLPVTLCIAWMLTGGAKDVWSRKEVINSWLDAYGHAHGKPAEVIYSQKSTKDCVRAMDILDRRDFFIELDGVLVKSDGMEAACAKQDIHKVVFWR